MDDIACVDVQTFPFATTAIAALLYSSHDSPQPCDRMRCVQQKMP